MTTRTIERRPKWNATTSAKRSTSLRAGGIWRHLAAFARFALIWLGGYLGVAGLLLLAWAFAT